LQLQNNSALGVEAGA